MTKKINIDRKARLERLMANPLAILSIGNALAVAIIIFLWSGYKAAKRYQQKQNELESNSNLDSSHTPDEPSLTEATA